jgi:hypothetical protein
MPVLASIRKHKENVVKKVPFFFHTCPHTSTASAPSTADPLQQSKKMDVLNDCLMTVAGTDFHVLQKGKATKGNALASHKYAGKSALVRYKLGVSILGGDLVWIQGPYPMGKLTDIKIFNKVLRHFFGPGGASRGQRGVCRTLGQNQVSPECGESGGEVGNVCVSGLRLKGEDL